MSPDPLREVQRVAAYALLRDRDGAVYLVPAVDPGSGAVRWSLPGGPVGHGEVPAEVAMSRAARLVGVGVERGAVRAVSADLAEPADGGPRVHTVRVVFDAVPAAESGPGTEPVPGVAAGPDPVAGPGASGAGARAVPVAELSALPLLPFAASVLGVARVVPDGHRDAGAVPVPPGQAEWDGETVGDGETLGEAGVPRDGEPPRVQRTGAYALVVDDGRVLLSRYVRSGRWSLPGGGIDHGEQPVDALRREVREETGLPLEQPLLLDVDSFRFTGRSPTGRLEDFHGIRIVYTGTVPPDAVPQVQEVDGTADAAAWIRLDELDRVEVTELVRRALRHPR